jgi:hypothetical protein
MVPIIPVVERKRVDREEDIEVEVANDDSSGSSAIDSMRPVVPLPRRKRRRRTIVDAFHHINLTSRKNGEQRQYEKEDGDADSSQAVAKFEASDVDVYSTTSSLEDEYEDDEDQDDRLLSDRDENERNVLLELVFGPTAPGLAPKNPVDLKLQELIRQSLQQQHQVPRSLCDGGEEETQDDMNIDAVYSRSAFSESRQGADSIRRSNSLPNVLVHESTVEEMDISDDL